MNRRDKELGKYNKRFKAINIVTMVAIISIILTTVIPTIEGYARTTRMNLKGSYDIKEEAVYLDWDTPNQSEPYTYQVFSKKPHEEEFQSISASNLDLD